MAREFSYSGEACRELRRFRLPLYLYRCILRRRLIFRAATLVGRTGGVCVYEHRKFGELQTADF